ncbi:MAG: right-handed parallel beta-helix repeat-containing protein [Acidobacteria bacterium]|nr:right-handed parallel beta-helix repeat-containing protein [Acidobacteriota bacterium]MBV9478728.1 right-handed parallel beta-helix repeat-containing protein [Acidobacteriota bacterium]
MLRFDRWVGVVCAVALPWIAAAQNKLVIAGGVYEDRPALAVRGNFTPIRNAAVKLYRGGAYLSSTRTDAAGLYAFPLVSGGEYTVAIDSRSFGENAWAEQTFGPSGARCAQPDGSTRMQFFEGACFGGKSGASDDASTLATSEHIAVVTVRDTPATAVDFAFSYDVVTSTNDGERIQGSLRQFLLNANAIGGPDRMRFVPTSRAPEQRQPIVGVPPRWWMITCLSPLPQLQDADTVVDGSAYNFLSPDTFANPNPGRLGEPPTLKAEDRSAQRIEKPELEIVASGPEGLVCNARCVVYGLALHGAPAAIVTRADARVENVILGGAPDAAYTQNGEVGLQVERGTTIARQVLVTAQTRGGVIVAPGARIDAEHLDVSRCGGPETGGGIVLLSDGSSIRASVVTQNPGAGVLVGSGQSPASGNTIDGNTISSNQAGIILWAGSSRNTVTHNDIMWNRLGGVTIAPYTNAPPHENRLSANRFDENGLRPIILNLGSTDPNVLARSEGSCNSIANAANLGIAPPQITSVQMVTDNGNAVRVVVRGKACRGQIVELYQSFVTSGVREESPDLPRVRNEKNSRGETLTNDNRTQGLPSIGEFNYVGATNAGADGTFEASFPLVDTNGMPRDNGNAQKSETNEETDIWARDLLRGAHPNERAFSAVAIDPVGNTSEMSVRRQVDRSKEERAER